MAVKGTTEQLWSRAGVWEGKTAAVCSIHTAPPSKLPKRTHKVHSSAVAFVWISEQSPIGLRSMIRDVFKSLSEPKKPKRAQKRHYTMILLNFSAVLCAASLRTQGHVISDDLSGRLSPFDWVVARAVHRDGAATLFCVLSAAKLRETKPNLSPAAPTVERAVWRYVQSSSTPISSPSRGSERIMAAIKGR